MLPSWMRSRNWRPRLVYFLAIEMTRRRFASTISFFACRASRSPFCTICTRRRNSWISSPVSVASDWISERISLIPVLSAAMNSFHPHVEADQALVDVVELLDQRVDAVLIERQRLDVADDVLLQRLIFALLSGRERFASELVLDVLILEAAQLLIGVGDAIESLEHAG